MSYSEIRQKIVTDPEELFLSLNGALAHAREMIGEGGQITYRNYDHPHASSIFHLTRQEVEVILPDGGTVLATYSDDGAMPTLSIESLIHSFDIILPKLRDFDHPLTITIPGPESRFYLGPLTDSSDNNVPRFKKAGSICFELMKEQFCNRILIPTGTDTLAYFAAYLERMIQSPSIPIILVASMRTSEDPDTDVYEKLNFARFSSARIDPGVYVALDNVIYSGSQFTKMHSSEINAFQPIRSKPVATLAEPEKWVFEPYLETNFIPRWMLANYSNMLENARSIWEKARGRIVDESGFNFHMCSTEEEFQKYYDHYKANYDGWVKSFYKGNYPDVEKICEARTPKLSLDFHEHVVFETITPGYKIEWLKSLIHESNDPIIISGLGSVDESDEATFCTIVKECMSNRPTVLFINPLENATEPEKKLARKLVKVGATVSRKLSIEAAVAELSMLAGQKFTQEEIRAKWGRFDNGSYIPVISAPQVLPFGKLSDKPTAPVHGIRYLHLTPGVSKERLEALITAPNVEAVILGGFGLGNIPSNGENELVTTVSKYATEKPIIVITQCPFGETNNEEYQVGVSAKRAGILSAKQRNLSETFKDIDTILEETQDIGEFRRLWNLKSTR